MQVVFEANDALEAHIVKGMLQAHGLEVTVQGDMLQGGVGELPPLGYARVMVEDDDYVPAREVIEQWLAEREPQGAARPRRAQPWWFWLLPVVVLAWVIYQIARTQ